MSRETVALDGGGEAYKCEYCSRLALEKRQIAVHEATCAETPERSDPDRRTL